MNYVTENDNMFPLCAIRNDKYINYLTNKEITNENTLNFIKKGIERNSLKIRFMDFYIYEIVEEKIVYGRVLSGFISDIAYYIPKKTVNYYKIAYNYQINDTSNYLDINRRPLSDGERRHIMDKLMDGTYVQKEIWGGSDE